MKKVELRKLQQAKDIIEEIKAMECSSNIYVSYTGKIVTGYYSGRGYRDGILIKRDNEVVTDWDKKIKFIANNLMEETQVFGKMKTDYYDCF